MHHQTNQLFYAQLKVVSMPVILQDSIHPPNDLLGQSSTTEYKCVKIFLFIWQYICTQESDEERRNKVECDPNKLSQEFEFRFELAFPAWEVGVLTRKLKTAPSSISR